MVYPTDKLVVKSIVDGAVLSKEVRKPRVHTVTKSAKFEIFLYALPKERNIPYIQLAKFIHGSFPDVRIEFINRRKMSITSKDMKVINDVILCEEILFRYNVQIPHNTYDVKGVVPISTEISEQEIFDNLKVFKMPYACPVQENPIIEVRRLQRSAATPGGVVRTDIDTVIVSFSGTVLPEKVAIFGAIFPVYIYREPVLQCRKCWKFNHTMNVCRSKSAVCVKCGQHHDHTSDECTSAEKCVNCNGAHSSNYKACPEFNKKKDAKYAKKVRVEQPQFSTSQSNFPALQGKNIRFAESVTSQLPNTTSSNSFAFTAQNHSQPPTTAPLSRPHPIPGKIKKRRVEASSPYSAPAPAPFAHVPIPHAVVIEEVKRNETWLRALITEIKAMADADAAVASFETAISDKISEIVNISRK